MLKNTLRNALRAGCRRVVPHSRQMMSWSTTRKPVYRLARPSHHHDISMQLVPLAASVRCLTRRWVLRYRTNVARGRGRGVVPAALMLSTSRAPEGRQSNSVSADSSCSVLAPRLPQAHLLQPCSCLAQNGATKRELWLRLGRRLPHECARANKRYAPAHADLIACVRPRARMQQAGRMAGWRPLAATPRYNSACYYTLLQFCQLQAAGSGAQSLGDAAAQGLRIAAPQ